MSASLRCQASRGHLFLTIYNSFDEWGKDNDLQDKNAALSAELERDSIADGELLDSVDSLVYTYDKDLSYKSHPDLIGSPLHGDLGLPCEGRARRGMAQARQACEGRARKGRHQRTLVHVRDCVWSARTATYIALSSDKSMADIDTGFAENKKFMDALGEDGVKQFHELSASAIDYSRSELFSINPKMSYVPDAWIKADGFWKPKAATPAAKPAAAEKKP